MRTLTVYSLLFFVLALVAGCQKSEYGNYPGAEVSPYISIYDLKSLYKESPVVLTKEVTLGSSSITGVVISDHSGGNIPEGLLVLQDARRLNQNRGIAVNIGAAAATYGPGDSVVVRIEGGTMERVNGILQITNRDAADVTKVGEGKIVFSPVIGDVTLLNRTPDVYENTVVIITQAEFDPPAAPEDSFVGDKALNNGSGVFTLHTEPGAAYAANTLPYLATYTGLLLRDDTGFKIWPRTEGDIIVLSDSPPVVAPVIITGFLNNSIGGDANYEYIQLMATRDIDFSETNISIVTCNNAGGSSPTGVPVNGWAIGGTRSYKFNLTSGVVTKGSFFYVGGNKVINGEGSTDISHANWIVSRLYNAVPGDDFGAVTGNLLANSGNVAGIAVFDTTYIDALTIPVDVVMFGGGGNNVFSAGPPAIGFRITSTDYYETMNTAVPTLDPQPFYQMGTNTFKFDLENDERFRLLGGVYNTRTGKWPVKRTMTNLTLPATAEVSVIETGGTRLE